MISFLFGFGTGIVFLFVWMLAAVVFAIKNQARLTTFAMKRMMKSAAKRGVNANR